MDAMVNFFRLDYRPAHEGETPTRFGFRCPRRDGHMCNGLLIRTSEHSGGKGNAPSWEWNGDLSRPTFKPSINCIDRGQDGQEFGGCGWHGYIRDGKTVEA